MEHEDAAEKRFRSLHAATYSDLLRFVKRRIPDDDADDVVSATYLIAWRRFAEMPDEVRPWLFGIARNLLANRARSRLRRSVVDVRMVADHSTAEAERSPGVDARIDLVRAWWTLSAADREVLALVAFDGRTVRPGLRSPTGCGSRRWQPPRAVAGGAPERSGAPVRTSRKSRSSCRMAPRSVRAFAAAGGRAVIEKLDLRRQ